MLWFFSTHVLSPYAQSHWVLTHQHFPAPQRDVTNPTWDPVQRCTHGVAGTDPVSVFNDLLGGDAPCGE